MAILDEIKQLIITLSDNDQVQFNSVNQKLDEIISTQASLTTQIKDLKTDLDSSVAALQADINSLKSVGGIPVSEVIVWGTPANTRG